MSRRKRKPNKSKPPVFFLIKNVQQRLSVIERCEEAKQSKIIVKNKNRAVLEEIADNINKNVPRVISVRLDEETLEDSLQLPDSVEGGERALILQLHSSSGDIDVFSEIETVEDARPSRPTGASLSVIAIGKTLENNPTSPGSLKGGETTFIPSNPDTEIIGTDIEASGKLGTKERVPSSRTGSSLSDNLIEGTFEDIPKSPDLLKGSEETLISSRPDSEEIVTGFDACGKTGIIDAAAPSSPTSSPLLDVHPGGEQGTIDDAMPSGFTGSAAAVDMIGETLDDISKSPDLLKGRDKTFILFNPGTEEIGADFETGSELKKIDDAALSSPTGSDQAPLSNAAIDAIGETLKDSLKPPDSLKDESALVPSNPIANEIDAGIDADSELGTIKDIAPFSPTGASLSDINRGNSLEDNPKSPGSIKGCESTFIPRITDSENIGTDIEANSTLETIEHAAPFSPTGSAVSDSLIEGTFEDMSNPPDLLKGSEKTLIPLKRDAEEIVTGFDASGKLPIIDAGVLSGPTSSPLSDDAIGAIETSKDSSNSLDSLKDESARVSSNPNAKEIDAGIDADSGMGTIEDIAPFSPAGSSLSDSARGETREDSLKSPDALDICQRTMFQSKPVAKEVSTGVNASDDSKKPEDVVQSNPAAFLVSNGATGTDKDLQQAINHPVIFVGAEEVIEFTGKPLSVSSPLDTGIKRCRLESVDTSEDDETDSDDDNWSDVTELDELMDALEETSIDPRIVDAVAEDMSVEIIRNSEKSSEQLNDTHESILGRAKQMNDISDTALEVDASLPPINSSTAFDDDYVPSDNSEDEESDEEVPDPNDPTRTAQARRSLNTTDPTIARGAVDDADMIVVPSRTTKKMNFCYYCKTMQTVISRHLEHVHKDEDDVKKFAVLKKGSAERRKIIETLRLNGNYIYNTDPAYNKGDLVVPRQPSERMKRTAGDFQPCHNCKGYFSKTSIRRHRQRCIGESSRQHRTHTVLSRKVAGRLHEAANKQVRDVIFPVMKEDSIVRLIRYDKLLILFANKLAMKYKQQQQHDMIRARLRHLGRLLRTAKSLDPEIDCFAAIYRAKHYDTIIKAINIEAGYDEEKNEYATPSVASSLGNYLKKVGKFWIVECIKNEDHEARKNAEFFLEVHEQEFCAKVNKLAVELTLAKNRKKKKPLPLDEDVKKLFTYLTEKFGEYYTTLAAKYSYDTWLNLLQVTLIALQLFNRRRAGEIERVTIEDYENFEKIDATMDPKKFASLSKSDQDLARKYVRFSIVGKLGKNVPVLLSCDMLKGVQLILKCRPNAKVNPNNPYVFGVPGFDKGRYKHLRACNLMRLFAVECGAQHPERLRGTALRKHMATRCAELNIDENQICDIALFMGHAEKIHRDHYRQPVAQRDVCGISRMLEGAVGLNRESDAEEDENMSMDAKDLEKGKSGEKQSNRLRNDSQKKRARSSVRSDSETSDSEYGMSETDNSSKGSKNSKRKKELQPQKKMAKLACKRARVQDRGKEIAGQETSYRKKKKLSKNLDHRTRKRKLSARSDMESNSNDDESEDSESVDGSEDDDESLCKKRRTGTKSGKSRKVRWTDKEKELAMSAFKSHIIKMKLPNVSELRAHIERNKKYVTHTEAQIRTWVSNQIAAKRQKMK